MITEVKPLVEINQQAIHLLYYSIKSWELQMLFVFSSNSQWALGIIHKSEKFCSAKRL